MPVLAYKPKLKSRLAESKNVANSPGPDLSETQLTCCLMLGVGGPLVMIAGAAYLLVLHQMGRLLLTSQSETDLPGFETGIGCVMLCFGGIFGIAGGFFYCEGKKAQRWKADQQKAKLASRRSSRARSSLAPLETINEGEEIEHFGENRQRSSSRRDRSKRANERRSRRSSASTSTGTPMTITTNNACSLSELHTYPFSSLESIHTFQTEAEIPPDYSTIFPEEDGN